MSSFDREIAAVEALVAKQALRLRPLRTRTRTQPGRGWRERAVQHILQLLKRQEVEKATASSGAP
jgi:hypothetical protein